MYNIRVKKYLKLETIMVTFTMTLIFSGGLALLLSRKIENENFAVCLRYLGVAGAVSVMYFWTTLPLPFHQLEEYELYGCIGTALYMLYAIWLAHDLIVYQRVYEEE